MEARIAGLAGVFATGLVTVLCGCAAEPATLCVAPTQLLQAHIIVDDDVADAVDACWIDDERTYSGQGLPLVLDSPDGIVFQQVPDDELAADPGGERGEFRDRFILMRDGAETELLGFEDDAPDTQAWGAASTADWFVWFDSEVFDYSTANSTLRARDRGTGAIHTVATMVKSSDGAGRVPPGPAYFSPQIVGDLVFWVDIIAGDAPSPRLGVYGASLRGGDPVLVVENAALLTSDPCASQTSPRLAFVSTEPENDGSVEIREVPAALTAGAEQETIAVIGPDEGAPQGVAVCDRAVAWAVTGGETFGERDRLHLMTADREWTFEGADGRGLVDPRFTSSGLLAVLNRDAVGGPVVIIDPQRQEMVQTPFVGGFSQILVSQDMVSWATPTNGPGAEVGTWFDLDVHVGRVSPAR